VTTDFGTDEIRIEVPADDDWDAISDCIMTAFNSTNSPEESAAERLCYEPERSLVARRGDEIVGTAGIYTRRLAVPGAVVAAAHVSLVSVATTARRQGVLTRFIRRQFDDIRAAGEPIAVLWASEGRIYQRFGYGLAAVKLALAAANREVSLLDQNRPGGRLREVSPKEVRDILVKLFDQAYRDRPGWSERGDTHWDYRLADIEAWRRDGGPLRATVHLGDDGPDGYALWRVSNSWQDAGPDGTVKILEHVATNPTAYAALWRFLLGVDLTRTTAAWACATDEPLLNLVNEPRRLSAKLSDALWLRLVDVPAALAARRYAHEVDLVIEVSDPLIPANTGRWHLRGGPDTASCEPTTAVPDLACDVTTLARVYLGRGGLAALAAGGLVTELRSGSLAPASTAFGWYREPSSVEIF
jgi:predicted acetyltransferase